MKIIKMTIAMMQFETLNLLVSRPGPHPCALQLLGPCTWVTNTLYCISTTHTWESQWHNVPISFLKFIKYKKNESIQAVSFFSFMHRDKVDFSFKNVFLYLKFIDWFWRDRKRERGTEKYRERKMDLLFHLSIHSLVDSCLCPDWGSKPQPWCIGMVL